MTLDGSRKITSLKKPPPYGQRQIVLREVTKIEHLACRPIQELEVFYHHGDHYYIWCPQG